ncbi:hypothetical protein PF003_g2002 [Phytophthora fragariae]|nr:hypothetical protein PF003_g2002 [Phytophthora fragariae]
MEDLGKGGCYVQTDGKQERSVDVLTGPFLLRLHIRRAKEPADGDSTRVDDSRRNRAED